MEVRKLKAGDRVVKKSGGPTMEVIKYVLERQLLVGEKYSEHDVECVWYDEEKKRHKEVFDQRTLVLVSGSSG